MTFITRPPLVPSWAAGKLVASIDTLRLSHCSILYFTVWGFTGSLSSRRLVRAKGGERGLWQLCAERLGKGRSCLSAIQRLLSGEPQPGASYPAGIQLERELLPLCLAAIAFKTPF